MPKRVIDFDAMWGSDKIAACAEWAQAEYAWLYGLADASGCFEVTNLRVIWGRVAAVRRNLTIERLEQILDEFQNKGLLFVWEHEGKRYAHWTGSDVPGRLPPPSWRARLERYAPPVPKQRFAEYMSKFARGRAALAGGKFSGSPRAEEEQLQFESSDLKRDERGAGLKDGVEEAQAQDWNLNWNRNQKGDLNSVRTPWTANAQTANSKILLNAREDQNPSSQVKAKADSGTISPGEKGSTPQPGMQGQIPGQETANPNANTDADVRPSCNFNANRSANTRKSGEWGDSSDQAFRAAASRRAFGGSEERGYSAAPRAMRDKWEQLQRDIHVGEGPSSHGPVRVNPEALERIRQREAELIAARKARGSG